MSINVMKPIQMPTVDHFAILYYRSINIPGDERSRTDPGHGYGPSVENVVEYRAFLTRIEWEAEIQKLEDGRYVRSYSAIIVTVPTITKKIVITTDSIGVDH